MSGVPDMVQRDPNNLSDHIKVAFEDVIGEPEGAHSPDCVWVNSYKCFNCSRDCCYAVLTALCAIPLSFCWGCEFAWITFQHVWQIGPSLRIFMINCVCAQKFFSTCLHCCLGPICETCGLFFSQITVKNS
ncbi:caveolin-1-like [Pomacea canaliculata]|uniref:caveolin-1-like n=1 Tax=Pomacea canaliculata TaxID=400727 RepID=UPI000D732CFB|nr:caveolin-1-like [Pomacea canaliculata]